MISVDVLSAAGKKVKKVELSEAVFGEKKRVALVHQAVKAQMAGWRAGTHSTKTRGKVSGGGVKPWRQKGTGRARAGSSRSPLWVGGGTVFGPLPRSYEQRLPRKMRKLALRSILSSKATSGSLVVVDEVTFAEPSTKKAAQLLALTAGLTKTTVVLGNANEAGLKSFRNLAKTTVILASQVNAYDLLNNRKLVVTEQALIQMTEALG